jgi:hypothetical protein
MAATKRYVETLQLPAPEDTCTQPKPFGQAAVGRAAAAGRAGLRRLIRRERRAALLALPIPALVGR